MADHGFKIRVLTEDGELVLEDDDFSEEARFDWFAESVSFAEEGELVQLIDTADERVICEERKVR